MLVNFTSFNERGMLRYRNSNDQHKEIHPGKIGNRAITAQLLAAGLASQEAVSDQEQVRRSKRQKPNRHIRQSSPEPAAQEGAARKKQRKEKDDAHCEACTALEANPHWADVEQEQVTREKDGRCMTFQTLKLSEAACCKKFGERRYRLLQGVSFARCIACKKVNVSLASGVKHRCKPKDQPHQPLQCQQQAGPLLQGGMQLNTAVLAQVRELDYMAYNHKIPALGRHPMQHLSSTWTMNLTILMCRQLRKQHLRAPAAAQRQRTVRAPLRNSRGKTLTPGVLLWMIACHHALVRVLFTVEGSTVRPLWTLQTRLLLRCALCFPSGASM